MAYIEVPKDLNRVKTKIAAGLTKRQLISFGSAAMMGFPVYFLVRQIAPNEIAMIALFIVAAPSILLGLYERDGIPAEELLKSYLKFKYMQQPIRRYKVTEKNTFLKRGVKETCQYKQ